MWNAILAGVVLALGCFFKQTQVVLSLVALSWIWNYRPRREALMAGVGFGGMGVVGCGLISLSFGAEAPQGPDRKHPGGYGRLHVDT